MKRNLEILFASVFVFALCACGKPANVDSFVAELDATGTEITKRIAANDVKGAKAYLDEKKAGLKASLEILKKIPEDKITEQDKEKLAGSVDRNLKALNKEIDIQSSRNSSASTDEEKLKRLAESEMLDKIFNDFSGIFR